VAAGEPAARGRARRADAALDARLAERPALAITGSGFRGAGIPDCVADGRAQARALAGRLEAPPRLQ